jgi:hypothetical protein
MAEKDATLRTFLIDIGDDDDETMENASKALGIPIEEVKLTLNFSRQIFLVAEAKGLTKGQLLTAIMSVASMLIRETTDTDEERADVCKTLFEGLWAASEIQGAPAYPPSATEIVH